MVPRGWLREAYPFLGYSQASGRGDPGNQRATVRSADVATFVINGYRKSLPGLGSIIGRRNVDDERIIHMQYRLPSGIVYRFEGPVSLAGEWLWWITGLRRKLNDTCLNPIDAYRM